MNLHFINYRIFRRVWPLRSPALKFALAISCCVVTQNMACRVTNCEFRWIINTNYAIHNITPEIPLSVLDHAILRFQIIWINYGYFISNLYRVPSLNLYMEPRTESVWNWHVFSDTCSPQGKGQWLHQKPAISLLAYVQLETDLIFTFTTDFWPRNN